MNFWILKEFGLCTRLHKFLLSVVSGSQVGVCGFGITGPCSRKWCWHIRKDGGGPILLLDHVPMAVDGSQPGWIYTLLDLARSGVSIFEG